LGLLKQLRILLKVLVVKDFMNDFKTLNNVTVVSNKPPDLSSRPKRRDLGFKKVH